MAAARKGPQVLQSFRSIWKRQQGWVCARCFSAASHRRLELAYDLHEPPSDKKYDFPKGNAIVFMHGLFGSKRNNRSISKVLARDLNRPVYAIDLRNHGDSPHAPHHDYPTLAADVLSFLTHHSLHKPTLIGHSMGAKVAMTAALHSPARIANLIPVDNAPVDAALRSDFGKYSQGMRAIDDAHVQSLKDADALLQPYEESLPIRQFLLTNLERAQPTDEYPRGFMKFRVPLKTLAGSLDHMADFPYKSADEARFEGPTLMVRGSKSKYVADETLPAVGDFFPRFELVTLEGGHWIISERPTEFCEAVVDFLESKE